MNYDKNSFLAGIAVGRQLKGWSTYDGVIPIHHLNSKELYHYGYEANPIENTRNPNENAWDPVYPFTRSSFGIILQQTDTTSHTPYDYHSLKQCGIASAVGIDMRGYKTIHATYNVVVPGIGGRGANPDTEGGTDNVILEISNTHGFKNGQPRAYASGNMAMAGTFKTLSVSIPQNWDFLDNVYYTFIILTDYFDNYHYQQFATIELKSLWLTK